MLLPGLTLGTGHAHAGPSTMPLGSRQLALREQPARPGGVGAVGGTTAPRAEAPAGPLGARAARRARDSPARSLPAAGDVTELQDAVGCSGWSPEDPQRLRFPRREDPGNSLSFHPLRLHPSLSSLAPDTFCDLLRCSGTPLALPGVPHLHRDSCVCPGLSTFPGLPPGFLFRFYSAPLNLLPQSALIPLSYPLLCPVTPHFPLEIVSLRGLPSRLLAEPCLRTGTSTLPQELYSYLTPIYPGLILLFPKHPLLSQGYCVPPLPRSRIP